MSDMGWPCAFYAISRADLGHLDDQLGRVMAAPAHAATRNELRDRLLDLVILQDYPHTHRDLFALGVH